MKRRSRLVHVPLALALAATLSLAGCGDDEPETEGTSSPTPSESTSEAGTPSETPTESPSPTEEAGQQVDVTIKGEEVTPVAQEVELGIGEKLVLNVASDRAGELHVHSNPEQEQEFEPGSTRIVLTFDKPGQVDVEEHESDALILRVLVS